MAGEDIDPSQLSVSQQDALQTYLAVTGQEPAAALPLLQRSEWNVQIAITKFFDGEGPDPVAEARASLDSPPTQPPRQPQNLMHDDLLPRSPFRPPRAVEPATRITTQSEYEPPYRPPFLLAIFFTPFNILYRLLSSSFRIFGTLFPFLPRLFNVITTPVLQGISGDTRGRRSLGPKDTAARFVREFEEEYGTHTLPLLENGYNMALEKAHKELKFLLVLLFSPEHDDTNSWIRNTLLSPEVVNFVNDPENQLLIWAGNVQDSEAYQVSNSLRCTKFPFAALITHTPNVSSTAMSIITRVTGPTTAAEFLEKLRTAISQNRSSLDRVRSTRAEQQASRSLREEQDSAYERSLAQDRERARQRREAEAARERAEREAQEQQTATEKQERQLDQWKRWRAQSIPAEPAADDKEAVRISIRLTSGERVVRRFAGHADIEELYAFVECFDVLQNLTCDDEGDVEEPEEFEHKYDFRLVSPMPRAVYEIEAGGSVRERIGRGGNLLVESIGEDDDDEDEDGENGEIDG
ncbi:hypothetical protein AJ80_00180 [Polytolypa hystricis UAMH7299]|uniref:UBX domain-containing protein n=1 Tax=Polytolypa hystricis (strain UAMH7299) TaxID=1447883 RepID=A0A2B7Z4W5_POLH7|nr:hypothetical protein AJ80_00180 [Polytolypa hystricis UAMH7299]